MSVRRRLAFALILLPAAFYVYACSSDLESEPTPGGDGGDETEGGPNPGNDSSVPGQDSSTGGDGSTGTDGGDGDGSAAPTCDGNPLLPDGGTDGGATVDASSVVQILTQNAGTFLDGPQWVGGQMTGGFLVFSEYSPNERVRRMAADGGALADFRTADLGDQLGAIGNAVRNGFVLTTGVAQNGGGTSVILQTATDGGGPGPSIPIGAEAQSPNDLVIGKNGSIYFTDPRYQAAGDPRGVYYTAGDAGGVTRVGLGFTGELPNGIALSPDGTKLYVAFTAPPRVDSYPVNPMTGVVTATATPVILAADLGDAPDGLAIDVGGNIWVAEANANTGNNSGRVEVFRPTGQKWGQLLFNNQRPTGVAFGGQQNKTLFVTVQEGVFSYVGRCAGIP